MPDLIDQVSRRKLVFQKGQETKEDWHTAEKEFRSLAEKHKLTEKDHIKHVEDNSTLAARRYAHLGVARIRFYGGYLPGDSFDLDDLHNPMPEPTNPNA
jgi:hypothetical protein